MATTDILKKTDPATMSALDGANAAIGSSGLLRVYDGAVPTDANTALGSQVTCAEFALDATPFGAASADSNRALSIMAGGDKVDSSTVASTGPVTFWRILTGAQVCCYQGEVSTTGAGDGSLQFDTTTFTAGGTATVSSFNIYLND